MNRGLVLALVGLVLIPAAVLIMLVAHVFGRWEDLIEQRVIRSARRAVEETVNRVEINIADELNGIAYEFTSLLRTGWNADSAATRISAVVRDRPLVEHAYLFSNPWGFVYPPELTGGERREPGHGVPHDLAASLRETLAGTRIGGVHRLKLANDYYFFVFLPEGNGVYAGMKIHLPELSRALWRAAQISEGEGISLNIDIPWLDSASGNLKRDVLISDSLSGTVSLPARSTVNPSGAELAYMPMRPPFDNITVSAYLQDPPSWRRAGAIRAKIFAWGTALLAISMTAGLYILWKGVRSELRRNYEKSAMIAGISHDLRTPLASIQMLSESLYDGRVDSEDRKQVFLSTILREARRLSQLVDRVLFFVRFGDKTIRYSREICRPDIWLRTAVSDFAARAYGPEEISRIRMDIEKSVPEVAIDRVALTQVLFNLLDNAFKYGRPGSDPATDMHISLYRVGATRRHQGRAERIAFSVRDFGPGIDPPDIRRIFDRFYRTEKSKESHQSGIGLGLSVCRQIVIAHGGNIVAENAAGGGARFTVILPTAIVERRT